MTASLLNPPDFVTDQTAATSAVTPTLSGRTMPVHYHVVPLEALIYDHRSPVYWAWRRLYDRDPGADPIQHPDYSLSEARYSSGKRQSPVVVIAQQGDDYVGLAVLVPKVLDTRRVGTIGLHRRTYGLRLAGNRFLQLSDDPAIADALYARCLEHAESCHAAFLLIEDLDQQTLLAQTVRRTTPTGWSEFRHAGIQPRRRIHFPQTPEEFWGQYSKKTRTTLKRKLKKFGVTRLECFTELVDVPRFLETAHAISLETWQTRQFGLRIRNNAEELELYSVLAQHGFLRSYIWYSDDQPVAFCVGHQDKGIYHYEEVGYKTPFAKYSPGLMMLKSIFDDLLTRNRPDWFDFGGGDSDYKQTFSNHESASGTLWLWRPSLQSRWLLPYLQGCRWLRQKARRAVEDFGLEHKARQLVRYGFRKPTGNHAESAPTESESDGDEDAVSTQKSG